MQNCNYIFRGELIVFQQGCMKINKEQINVYYFGESVDEQLLSLSLHSSTKLFDANETKSILRLEKK